MCGVSITCTMYICPPTLCCGPLMTAFFFIATPTIEIYTLSLHDALPIWAPRGRRQPVRPRQLDAASARRRRSRGRPYRSEEHTSELQSLRQLVCRLLLEKKNTATAPSPANRCLMLGSGTAA